ncbi:MAG: dihydroxyacetone kinase subunit DhaK, partial [Acetanaerobacterium sp.]
MKKFINDPANFVEESLAGILAAHPRELRSYGEDVFAICKASFSPPDKVSIVTGGGFGHLPVFLGYVGEGLCDGVAVGNVFSSPSSDT